MKFISRVMQLISLVFQVKRSRLHQAEFDAEEVKSRPKVRQSRQTLKRRAMRGGFSISINERITGRGRW